MRFVLWVLALAMLAATSAIAASEEKCASKYSLEEQMALEWAALGGDPHAQFAIAECAAPEGETRQTRAERIYALKWLMLAACDVDGLPRLDERDRMTRRLKYNGDISFRRFNGIMRSERWTAREKKFIEYRREKSASLLARYDRFIEKTTPVEQMKARNELSDELARLGPRGLLRLTDIAQCKYFGADEVFIAAAFSAAEQVWHSSNAAEIYGESVRKNWDLSKQSKSRLAGLAPAQRRAADAEKRRLLRTDPFVLAELEDDAALARLGDLSFMHAQAERVSFVGRSVTLAAQYALEALGWIEFINGPDNDYGPATIEAARKAQAAYGFEDTRWLSPEQIRLLVCDAATKRSDPVSFYHLALMYSEGWGFPKDLDRASYAIARAQSLLGAALADSSDLPAWKQSAYPSFQTKIENARAHIAGEQAASPVHAALREGAVDDSTLCN